MNKKFARIISATFVFMLIGTMLFLYVSYVGGSFADTANKTPKTHGTELAVLPVSGFMEGKEISWALAESIVDENGKKIVDIEWKDKQDIYNKEGFYSVSYRLKNEKGKWSDWLTKAFYVYPQKKVVHVASGETHTLILFEDGTIYAVGLNKYGQLGDGTFNNSEVPVQVKGITNAKAVCAGFRHSFALLEDGTLMAWGLNEQGQLGDGTTENRNVPVPVLNIGKVAQVSSRGQNNIALTEDGKVYVWGWNKEGYLAGEGDEFITKPKEITGLSNVTQVAAGYWHFAVLLDDGTVMTWGFNAKGQLGTGDNEDHLSPVKVDGIPLKVKQIALGNYHSLAVTEDGVMFAWGDNERGQLGIGTFGGYKNSPIQVLNIDCVAKAAAGAYDSMAIIENGLVKSWGHNDQGQLGVGDYEDRNAPIPINNLTRKGIVDISPGYYHTAFVNENGTLLMSGWNHYGQLGNGSSKDVPKIASPITIIDNGEPEIIEDEMSD